MRLACCDQMGLRCAAGQPPYPTGAAASKPEFGVFQGQRRPRPGKPLKAGTRAIADAIVNRAERPTPAFTALLPRHRRSWRPLAL